jgi:hypothetical protein
MALIKCKECGAEVSSKAETCPKCGARVTPKPMGCGTAIGVVILAGIILTTLGSIFSSGTSSNGSSDQTASTPEPPTPGSQWNYHQDIDAMGKGTSYEAYVASTNAVTFDFPYHGAQHATLTLRTHPRWGKAVIFQIERGQLLCRSYDGCNVLVRFDDEQPSPYSATGPSDNSTETLFIQNYNRFIGKMLKSKRVRISADVYQEGAPVFEFDVSHFDQAKYKPKS